MRRRKGPPLLTRRRPGEAGQALLELALVTPILALLVMAIFQFAFVLQTQMGMENALREAARRAAATTEKAPTWPSLRDWVQAQLCGDITPPCDGGLLLQNVQAFDGTKLWVDPPPVTFCSYAAAGTTNYRVKVQVKYEHPLFFGPMAFATDLIDGTQNGYWDLSASAEMRLQNVDSSVATDPGACPP
jgi:TadE-like protein